MKILCKSIIDLNKQRYVIIKDDIENIIRNNIKEDKYIQRTLDGMLDVLLFYENADTLLSFIYFIILTPIGWELFSSKLPSIE